MVDIYNRQLADKDNVKDILNDATRALTFLTTQINDLITTNAKLVSVTISTTATPVAHNLGYIYRGVIPVKKSANFDVYEDTTAVNPDRLRYAMLRTSSGTQTCTLMFF